MIVPSTPATIEIGWLATPAPLALVSRKMTWLLALLGSHDGRAGRREHRAGDREGSHATSEPLVAVTVMSRFDGSAPIETVATLVPSDAVVAADCVNVAPLSTENETGIPASACPEAVVAVAVALTVAAPVFWMLAVSSAGSGWPR